MGACGFSPLAGAIPRTYSGGYNNIQSVILSTKHCKESLAQSDGRRKSVDVGSKRQYAAVARVIAQVRWLYVVAQEVKVRYRESVSG